MTFFAISTRRIVGQGGARRFEAEPGLEASYLATPVDSGAFRPDQKLRGENGGRAAWTKAVLETFAPDQEGRQAGDLVFLVHGYNVDAKDAFEAHGRFTERLRAAGFPHTLVSFDWPAQGSFLNYLEDSADAFKTAPLLVESGISLFAQASRPDCRVRVHVVAHSMGAYVTREAFRQARGHPPSSQDAWGLNQLILVAADISAGSIGGDLAEDMCARAQRITSYYSAFDAALATSNVKRFLSSPRLGRHGSGGRGPQNVVDVDCSERWRAFSRDTPGGGLFGDIPRSHTWYFEDQAAFFPDLAATLTGDLDRAVLPTRERREGRLSLRLPG